MSRRTHDGITSLQLERVVQKIPLDVTCGIWRVAVPKYSIDHRVCDLVQAINVASLRYCRDVKPVLNRALAEGFVVGEGVHGAFFIGREGGAE
ncbi:MAG: hypothetical protein KME14_26030 [Tildeniella torsiva UHER 1998/13D]|jgi:hypothetical protein|nr:hypothetical protein [Tildeniella torsiva UHER 1998/13D]